MESIAGRDSKRGEEVVLDERTGRLERVRSRKES